MIGNVSIYLFIFLCPIPLSSASSSSPSPSPPVSPSSSLPTQRNSSKGSMTQRDQRPALQIPPPPLEIIKRRQERKKVRGPPRRPSSARPSYLGSSLRPKLTIGGRGVELLGKLEDAAELTIQALYALPTAQLHELAQLLERDAILRRSSVNGGHPARSSRSSLAHHAHGTPLHRPCKQRQKRVRHARKK